MTYLTTVIFLNLSSRVPDGYINFWKLFYGNSKSASIELSLDLQFIDRIAKLHSSIYYFKEHQLSSAQQFQEKEIKNVSFKPV